MIRMLERNRLFIFLVCLFLVNSCDSERPSFANETIHIEKLADAIYLAEGGAKTRHPYGILKKYKTTTPRQACINTIKSGLKRYASYKGSEDFITFLGRTYCPTEGNKLTLLEKKYNINWVKNVKHFYYKGK